MDLRSVRPILVLVVLAAAANAQPEPSQPSELPSPGCDSYSMQTLPGEKFGWKQRTCYWRGQLFTFNAIFGANFNGAIAQITHSPEEWPLGAEGYGRRVGTRYLKGMAKSTATYLVGGALLEDPRPRPPELKRIGPGLPCSTPVTTGGRLRLALLRPVWDPCRRGHVIFGPVAGAAAASGLDQAWAVSGQRNVNNFLKGTATGMGGYFAASLFGEFQGDLFGWFGRAFATGKPATAAKAGGAKGGRP